MKQKILTNKEFLDEMDLFIYDHYRSALHAAEVWGVSRQYVSKVLMGERAPTDAMLDDMGYIQHDPQIYYTRIKND